MRSQIVQRDMAEDACAGGLVHAPGRGLLPADLAQKAGAARVKWTAAWNVELAGRVALQPDQLVTAPRTNHEPPDTPGVLDGHLDAIIGAARAARVGETRGSTAE